MSSIRSARYFLYVPGNGLEISVDLSDVAVNERNTMLLIHGN